MKKFLPFVLAALVVAAYPAAAGAAGFKGVVVARDGGTALVASPSGVVRAFHATPRVGSRVALRGSRLLVVGRAHRAVIRGVLVRRTGSLRFISAAKHVLVLRHTGRVLSSAAQSAPQPGAVVQTQVQVNGDELEEENEHEVGQAGQVDIQATVTAVGNGTVTLSVNGQPLTLTLPGGLTLPANVVGTTVTLKLGFAGGQAKVEDEQGDDDQGDDDGGDDDGD